ncbi:MAG: hypothetical protein AB7O26_02785 [Planctomycetaceae bacterium]
MTTLNLQVAHSADDAFEDDQGDTSITGTAHICDQNDEYFGHRWRNVTIPQGSTIHSASLQVYITSGSTDEPDVYTLAEAADNAAAFSAGSGNEDLSTRTLVSTSLAVEVAQSDLGSSGGFATMTPTNPPNNYGALVSVIVNRPGWASGNSLVFITRGNPGVSLTRDFGLDMYDLNSARGAKLDIDFTAGGSTIHSRTTAGEAGLATLVAALRLTTHARLVSDTSFGCATVSLLQRIFARLAAEQLRIADEAVRQSDANRFRTESIGTTDAVRTRATLLRAVADELGVEGDAAASSLLIRRLVADIAAATDGSLQSVEWERRAVELLSGADGVERAVDVLRALFATISAGDDSNLRRIRDSIWPGDTSVDSLGPETIRASSAGPGETDAAGTGPGSARPQSTGPGDVTIQGKLLRD